jgi:hypothetical protein
MGNRTFIIMLSACLVQVLVVTGTVTYIALRDGGATEVVEAESANALGDNVGKDTDDMSHDIAEESLVPGDDFRQERDYADDRSPTGDTAPAGGSQSEDGQSSGYY